MMQFCKSSRLRICKMLWVFVKCLVSSASYYFSWGECRYLHRVLSCLNSFLQAFSQMRLSEASAHLGSFWGRVKEESMHFQSNTAKDVNFGASWISRTAVKAADAVLSACPSPYEKRCLLQLLAATDFGDGGSAATYYRRLYWKVNLAEPSLRENDLDLGNESLDDGSLLTALEKNRQWEQARNWAKQLETIGATWTSSVHHVTETQVRKLLDAYLILELPESFWQFGF